MVKVEKHLLVVRGSRSGKAVLVDDRTGNAGQTWIPVAHCRIRQHHTGGGRYGEGYHEFVTEVAEWWAEKNPEFISEEVA
jgi:hypothetical protein